MRLSAVDIESRQFRRKPRLSGYSVREVEEFRQEVSDNYEELLVENARLKEQLETLLREVERYRSIEQNLNESLLLGQRTAEEIRQAARQQAEAILRDAETEARELLLQARQERIEMEGDLARLAGARERFLQEFRALLYSHLQRVEDALARSQPEGAAPELPPAEERQPRTGTSQIQEEPVQPTEGLAEAEVAQELSNDGAAPPVWLRRTQSEPSRTA